MGRGRDPLIERKERELERLKLKVESLEEKWTQELKKAHKDEDTRQQMAKECYDGVEGRTGEARRFKKLGGGQVAHDEHFDNEGDVPTGSEERYWDEE